MAQSKYRVGDYLLIVNDPTEIFNVGGRQYFPEDALFHCDLIKISTVDSRSISVSCEDLFTPKKGDDGRPYIESDDDSPRQWLFKLLKATKMDIEVTPFKSVNSKSPKVLFKYTYLKSDIGDEDIKTSSRKRTFLINELSELDWLESKGFSYF